MAKSSGDKDEDNNLDGFFLSPTDGRLTINQMVDKILGFVDEYPESFYKLIIGTDSQTRSNGGSLGIDFVTAVVIYRKGRGARYFWRKKKENEIPRLRDKIYTETLMSLELAKDLVPQIRKKISPAKYDLEIHIDVGPLGPTREMIREVVGIVNGNGYMARTKPDSWGASSVADKHT